MKRIIFLKPLGTLCIALFLISCQKDLKDINPQITANSTAVVAQSKMRVPFKGDFVTSREYLSAPPLLRLRITATGTASHLGQTTAISYPTIDFRTPPPFHVSGTQVMTAANGDQVFVSFTGYSFPPDANGVIVITASNTITGGTGRFADATGSFHATSLAHTHSPVGSFSFEGTISY